MTRRYNYKIFPTTAKARVLLAVAFGLGGLLLVGYIAFYIFIAFGGFLDQKEVTYVNETDAPIVIFIDDRTELTVPAGSSVTESYCKLEMVVCPHGLRSRFVWADSLGRAPGQGRPRRPRLAYCHRVLSEMAKRYEYKILPETWKGRIGIVLIILTVLIFFVGGFIAMGLTHDEIGITFENQTGETVVVVVDGEVWGAVGAGESQEWRDFRSSWKEGRSVEVLRHSGHPILRMFIDDRELQRRHYRILMKH